jgi:acylphosphatase
VRVTISGRVQGVGFRAFVSMQARAMGASGWVRNRRDGAVEALITSADVDGLIAVLRRGPGRVDDIRVEDADPDGRSGGGDFTITPTL